MPEEVLYAPAPDRSRVSRVGEAAQLQCSVDTGHKAAAASPGAADQKCHRRLTIDACEDLLSLLCSADEVRWRQYLWGCNGSAENGAHPRADGTRRSARGRALV